MPWLAAAAGALGGAGAAAGAGAGAAAAGAGAAGAGGAAAAGGLASLMQGMGKAMKGSAPPAIIGSGGGQEAAPATVNGQAAPTPNAPVQQIQAPQVPAFTPQDHSALLRLLGGMRNG